MVQQLLKINYKTALVSNKKLIIIGESITYLREATIRVWVLTGDKIETAINIGFSSGLLDSNMVQIHVTSAD